MTLKEFKTVENLLKAGEDDFFMAIEAIKHYIKEEKCNQTHLYLLSKCLLFHKARTNFINKLNLEGIESIVLISDGLINSDRQVMLNLTSLYNNKNLVDKKDKDLMKIFNYIIEEVIFRLIRSLKLDEIIDNIKIKLK